MIYTMAGVYHFIRKFPETLNDLKKLKGHIMRLHYSKSPFISECELDKAVELLKMPSAVAPCCKPVTRIYFRGSIELLSNLKLTNIGMEGALVLDDEVSRFAPGMFIDTSGVVDVYHAGSELVVETHNTRYIVVLAKG